jgi:hypothetical protein
MRFAKFKRLHITFTASDEKGVSHRLTEEIDFENINAAEFVLELRFLLIKNWWDMI